VARVLILEPDAELRRLFTLQLSSIGHEVADDAGADPDLLLVEPASNAMFRRALGMRHARPDLPIVCVSISEDTRIARDLAPSSFLVKPFPVDRLRAALAEALAPV